MKLIISLLIAIFCIFNAYPYQIQVKKINTGSIRIGNKLCEQNSYFEDSDEIHWTSPKQDLWVMAPTKDGPKLLHFTPETFSDKKVSTGSGYLKAIHMSTKGDVMTLETSKVSSSYPEKRIALVIGNSNYDNLSTLNSPINDCADISEKLLELGFDVYSEYDLNYSNFDAALKRFSHHARNYDVALVYYSGHGLEYDSHNYLIPIDGAIESADDRFNYIELDDIYSQLNRTNCKTKLVFYDACSNTPEWRGNNASESGQRSDIYTIYSSTSNAFSFDGVKGERNSPFTAAFLSNVDRPHKTVSSLVDDITRDVETATSNAQHVTVIGLPAYYFTFSNKTDPAIINDYSILDINHLENLANNGDVKACIAASKYWLINDASMIGCENSYHYAILAWNAGEKGDDVKSILNKLDALGYFIYCPKCDNPAKTN